MTAVVLPVWKKQTNITRIVRCRCLSCKSDDARISNHLPRIDQNRTSRRIVPTKKKKKRMKFKLIKRKERRRRKWNHGRPVSGVLADERTFIQIGCKRSVERILNSCKRNGKEMAKKWQRNGREMAEKWQRNGRRRLQYDVDGGTLHFPKWIGSVANIENFMIRILIDPRGFHGNRNGWLRIHKNSCLRSRHPFLECLREMSPKIMDNPWQIPPSIFQNAQRNPKRIPYNTLESITIFGIFFEEYLTISFTNSIRWSLIWFTWWWNNPKTSSE